MKVSVPALPFCCYRFHNNLIESESFWSVRRQWDSQSFNVLVKAKIRSNWNNSVTLLALHHPHTLSLSLKPLVSWDFIVFTITLKTASFEILPLSSPALEESAFHLHSYIRMGDFSCLLNCMVEWGLQTELQNILVLLHILHPFPAFPSNVLPLF